MNVHVLQHVSFEGLGCIKSCLEVRGADIGWTRFFAGDPLPRLDAVDFLVAMGGPMSANDGDRLPWLGPEKQTILEAISKDIPVLGVCLGAQLVASALGARVYRNELKEIGWFPIEGVAASDGAFTFPSKCLAFHWHGETFDLPEGAVHLAKSAGCANQAFQLKNNVIGLQFHLEITADDAQRLVENCRSELVPGPYVQTADQMLGASAAAYRTINGLMSDVLAYLLD